MSAIEGEIEQALAEAVRAVAAARRAVYRVATAYGDADEQAMARGDAHGVRIHAYLSGQVDEQAVAIEGVARQLRRLRRSERKRTR